MTFDPQNHRRRSIRLKGHDYSQAGAYFITICTQDRACLFGEVVDGEMRLNEMGRMVELTWFDLPNHVDGLVLDSFVVMPNHLHGIVAISDVGAGSEPAPTGPAPTAAAVTTTGGKKRHGLPEIVRQLKTFSARRINEHRQTPGLPVWQRNYYEHIIRDEASLMRIREYIANNPMQWASDRENPNSVGAGSEPAPTEPAPTGPALTIGTEPWRI